MVFTFTYSVRLGVRLKKRHSGRRRVVSHAALAASDFLYLFFLVSRGVTLAKAPAADGLAEPAADVPPRLPPAC